jgi:MFS family permease
MSAKPGSRPQLNDPRRTTLGGMSAVHFVHDGIGDGLLVLLPAFAQMFGLSYAQVGIVRSAYSASLAFLQVPAGMLAERTSERTLLTAGTLLAGLAFGFLAASQSFGTLVALVLLAGVGSAVQHPLASMVISRAYPPASRRAALGVYNFSGDLGKMVVAAGIGAGIATAGWQPTVVAYGLVVAAAGLVALFSLGRIGKSPSAGPTAGSPRDRVSGWGFIDPRGFTLLGAIHVVDSACRTGLLTFLPFLLIGKGASIASVGLGLALVFVGGAAGKLVCGLLADRVGIIRTVIATELATSTAIVAIVLLPLAWVTLLLVPLGVALNGTSSVLYGTVAEFVREDRQARSFGLFYTLGSAASASAPLLFGLFSDRFDVPVALLLVAGLAAFTIPIAWLLGPHIGRNAQSASTGR